LVAINEEISERKKHITKHGICNPYQFRHLGLILFNYFQEPIDQISQIVIRNRFESAIQSNVASLCVIQSEVEEEPKNTRLKYMHYY
jgi:hypothetical protein